MPHVTLAYRHGDHEPGETIEVSEEEAAGLVRDGLAQRSGEPTAADTDDAPADDEDEGGAA